jgi:DnaK suppressor protein
VTSRAALRRQLTAQREIATGQMAALARDLAAITGAQEFVATDDEHDPEGATIAFERAQLASLVDSARARIADVERALARLDAGGYGTCERCGGQIGAERLAALPTATACIACASARR